MNNVEQIAAMLGHGGKTRIAEMCEISTFLVSRWVRSGQIPAKYNFRMKRGLADLAATAGHGDAWLAEAVSYLQPDICPTCGQEWEMHK